VSQGCPPEHSWFVESRESVFGAFPAEFGRTEYTWDADTGPIERVLSIVDCFLTLCDREPVPSVLRWDPITRVEKPAEWRAGGVHEPEVVRRWEEMPGCAERVLHWIKNKVFIKPTKKIPRIRKNNARCLRPGDEEYDEEKHAFVDGKVRADRAAGVAHRLGPNPPHATCPLNAVPKPGGGEEKYRVIGSMIALNRYFPGWKTKFEDLRHFPAIFEPDHFLFNLDQKAAYHTVHAHPWMARLFGFSWDGQYWQWSCLPFGFRLSPFVYCRIVKQLVKLWRRAGLSILSFVDDQAAGAGSFAQAVLVRNRMLRDNMFYGFTLSTKSVPLPMQRILFLGYVEHLACPVPKFHVPAPKVEALQALAKETLHSFAAESSWRSVSEGMRRVVDVCSGMCCMPLAHWLDFPESTFILAVDIMPEEDFWDGVPAEVHESITYIKLDVLELTVERLCEEVMKAWGCTLSGVSHLHWSHMCTTLSRASRGRGGHRYADFSPKSDDAIAHDMRFHAFLGVIEVVARLAPLICISLENPKSEAFSAFPDLQALAKKPGWRFVAQADHCVMADKSDVARGAKQANKPSSWLFYGVGQDVDFLECDRSCAFRISPHSRLHRWLICRRKRMHPSQRVIECVREKSRIPFGACRFIFRHHMEWMRGAEAARLVAEVRRMPMKKLAKIIGRLISMGLAVAPAQLMCRELQRALYSNEVLDWEAWVTASPGAVEEFLWLAKHLAEWNLRGIPIWKAARVVDVVLTQDSSPVGVGFRIEAGTAGPLEGHMPFKVAEAGLAHVHREMVGLVFVVAVHHEAMADRSIQIRVDSKSTIKYVRDRGGPSEVMTHLAKILWGLLIRHRISLALICHISGVEMVRCGVDGLSRPVAPKPLSELDRLDWQLTPEWWQWTTASLARFGVVLSCDRFASRANALLRRFCSVRAEPGALSPPNAFVHDWARETGWNWAFPPMRDIPRVMALLREQRARAVVLVPDWKMHWFASATHAAKRVLPLEGQGPFFRRLRDGEWETVHSFLFRPLLLLVDWSGARETGAFGGGESVGDAPGVRARGPECERVATATR
jgi:hypothetical protein